MSKCQYDIVEFVGGPLCGEKRALPLGCYNFTVEMRSAPKFTLADEPIPTRALPLRRGDYYRPSLDVRTMTWQGER